MNDTLAVIIPVYNEEEAIALVLRKWASVLGSLQIDYLIHAYNDGSRDKSLEVLNEVARENTRICVHDKKNSGHGPTILQGYRENCDSSTWLFQMDSDDEMGPESFPLLWEKRSQYDFLLGQRDGRFQPLSRKVISFISRLCVKTFYGSGVWDVNSPYRLMRSECFKGLLKRIPADTFAPNVIISGFVNKKKLRYFECPVPHTDRKTGCVSIKKWKLLKAALRSFKQTVMFSFNRFEPSRD